MPCGYPLSCVLLASLILLGISTEASPPQAGCAALHEQAHQRAGFFGAQPEFSARLLLRGGGDAPGGEDAAAELVERIRAGGKVRLEAGDHFCGEDDGVIRVHEGGVLDASSGNRRKIAAQAKDAEAGEGAVRIWGPWELDAGSSGQIEGATLCWETKTGFTPTLRVSSGPWKISSCDVICGGGPAMELADGASVAIFRGRVGGFGTGPHPSASVGILASGKATCSLVQSGVQHCVTHPVRVLHSASATLEQCWVKNCGRPFGQEEGGMITVL